MGRRGNGWGLRAAVALGLLAAFVLVPALASASGGGGCGRSVTDEAGTTVEIRWFCFGPTILRAPEGATVTFVNQDPVPHNVLGAAGAWGGYERLGEGREVSYTFTEPGVYPYACTYHPGMVGAVVVGDGAGGAIETTTAAGPVVEAASLEAASTEAREAVATLPPRTGAGAWPAIALGTFGLLVASGAIGVVRRSRRRSVA